MERAALRISNRISVKGFRKGKTPYNIIKKEVGEMNILNEALESIVQETFYKVATEENLDTIGMPQIEIEKMAPGNELIYKAKVAILPEITLGDLSGISVQHKTKTITDKQIDDIIETLRKMQAKEVIKQGSATKDDMVLIDMNMKDTGVPIEGGQAKNYRVYLGEEHYIPGFNEQLVQAQKGDQRTFDLDFPNTHYQKHLAGKKVSFEISVKDVFSRELPELNDDFAKKMGKDTVQDLKDQIKKNLEEEALEKAKQQAEIEIFDSIIEKSTFGDLPEVLVDAERKKMFYELQRDLERNGISTEQYLLDIKKSEKDLFNDFKSQAEKRAKASLISRHIAKKEGIIASEDEVEKEIGMMKDAYKNNTEYLDNLKKTEVKDTIRVMLQNKKVLDWLKNKILKV